MEELQEKRIEPAIAPNNVLLRRVRCLEKIRRRRRCVSGKCNCVRRQRAHPCLGGVAATPASEQHSAVPGWRCATDGERASTHDGPEGNIGRSHSAVVHLGFGLFWKVSPVCPQMSRFWTDVRQRSLRSVGTLGQQAQAQVQATFFTRCWWGKLDGSQPCCLTSRSTTDSLSHLRGTSTCIPNDGF